MSSHRSAFGRLILAVALCLAGGLVWAAPSMPLTFTEPYLVSLTPAKSMSVIWLTSEPTSQSFVLFGRDQTFKKATVMPARTYEIEGLKTMDESGQYTVPLKVYQQIVELKGLKAGTRYFYRAVSNGAQGRQKIFETFDFVTAPERGRPVKGVLISDLQLKRQVPATLRQIGQTGADLFLYNGDLQNTPYKAGEWFDLPGTTEESDKRWFNVLQQKGNGIRLLQYTPIFPAPGNHEVDDQALLVDPAVSSREKMTLKIFMQLFRPLYPGQQFGADGKHWYSVDFGDLHIVSLSLFRWFAWQPNQAPGWFLFDTVSAESPQFRWLKQDLAKASASGRYIWITQHWHMFNRSTDVDTPFTEPQAVPGDPTQVTYDPAADHLLRDYKPLLEKYGVNAVSYGHSHVYERYVINGVNYIEAATIGNNYRSPNDPPCSPNNGACPVFEENRFRSFMVFSLDSRHGLTAEGIQASVEADGIGFIGRVFDSFTLAGPKPRPGFAERWNYQED